MAYEAVIGLECHIQLSTGTKMFCDCPAEFGAAPNSNVCPVCLGLPGALPRTNREAVDCALRLGLALGCAVRAESVFSRKNYFYPDMPKNYQISQYDQPLCEGGALPVGLGEGARSFALIRIHVEEDTGKSFHPERVHDRRISRVDFNRAGVPLLEIVTQPVFREPAECAAFLTELRRLVRWLGISDGDMEKGQLRCDANVSIRPAGESRLGTKTEIKNLNSIKAVEKGLAAEIARQRRVVEGGGRVEQATLLYDPDHEKLAVMRTKEHAHDYRYFPEPDLPVLRVDEAWIRRVREELARLGLPWERMAELVGRFGLDPRMAFVLTDQASLHAYAMETAAGVDPRLAFNWVVNDVLGAVNERRMTLEEWRGRVPPARLQGLLRKVAARELTGPIAKQVFAWMIDEAGGVEELLGRHGVKVQASPDELLPLVRGVLEENPGPVQQYLGGKHATLGFLVGQVMKKTGGQADPVAARRLLEEELAARR